MQGKTGADDFAVSGPGNQIVELRLDQLQPGGPGVDMEEVVVVERRVVVQFGPDDGIDVAAFLDLPVGVLRLPHQFGAADFEIAQIVGVIDHLRAVGVHVERPACRAVPDQRGGRVAHIAGVQAGDGFGTKWFGPHYCSLIDIMV